MTETDLVLPRPGQPVPEGWNLEYRKQIARVTDVEKLVRGQAKLDGLFVAFRKLGLDANELGRAAAWTELQIGVALGRPPGKGAGGPGRELLACNSLLPAKSPI